MKKLPFDASVDDVVQEIGKAYNLIGLVKAATVDAAIRSILDGTERYQFSRGLDIESFARDVNTFMYEASKRVEPKDEPQQEPNPIAAASRYLEGVINGTIAREHVRMTAALEVYKHA